MQEQSLRLIRLTKLFSEEISNILQNEISDPRLADELITISRISITPDMHHADVYFTVLNEKMKNKIFKGLTAAAPYIMNLLKRRIKIKYIPKLHFKYDFEFLNADKVVGLIDKIQDQYNNKEEPQ